MFLIYHFGQLTKIHFFAMIWVYKMKGGYSMNPAAILWFALLLVFLFMEANTVSLVSVWFAGGALVAMIASLCGALFWVQALLFVAVSGLMLILLRPFLRKFITPRQTKTNLDAIIGSKGMVLAEINNDLQQGKVRLGAMEWTARSTDGSVLTPGTQVVVDKIEGVKAFVSPVKAEQTVS